MFNVDIIGLKESKYFILNRERFSHYIYITIGEFSYKTEFKELQNIFENYLGYNQERSNRILSYLYNFSKVIIDTNTGILCNISQKN